MQDGSGWSGGPPQDKPFSHSATSGGFCHSGGDRIRLAVLAKTAASPALGLWLRPSLVPLSTRCPSFSTPLSSHPRQSGGPFPRAAGTQAPGLGLWGTGFQPPGYVAGAPRGIEDNVRVQLYSPLGK